MEGPQAFAKVRAVEQAHLPIPLVGELRREVVLSRALPGLAHLRRKAPRQAREPARERRGLRGQLAVVDALTCPSFSAQ